MFKSKLLLWDDRFTDLQNARFLLEGLFESTQLVYANLITHGICQMILACGCLAEMIQDDEFTTG